MQQRVFIKIIITNTITSEMFISQSPNNQLVTSIAFQLTPEMKLLFTAPLTWSADLDGN